MSAYGIPGLSIYKPALTEEEIVMVTKMYTTGRNKEATELIEEKTDEWLKAMEKGECDD